MSARQSRGFTLIELVMAIILVGSIAAIAVPKLGSLGSYSLRDASQELIEAIRYAQSLSLIQSGDNNPYTITLSGNGYAVSRADGSAVSNPLTGASSYSSSWPGISLSPTGTIRFASRGNPICSGALAPCSSSSNAAITFTLSGSGEATEIRFEPLTGYLHRP
ncbi:MAG: prepilin-type N-terminal cleavage/methylation domain-containing protein [Gammaproteobacteria bacterium]|nr:prepilin-type N-terminal cleavage/methylation domain-containing protein [Gammaproteobacteria bacterium]